MCGVPWPWPLTKLPSPQDVLGEWVVPVNPHLNPDTSLWYSNVPQAPTSDLDKAQAVSTEAGFPQGLTVSLPVTYRRSPVRQNRPDVTKTPATSRYSPPGINPARGKCRGASTARHLGPAALRGEESPTDPDDVYFATLHSSRIDHSNISGYSAPALDTLLVTAR